MSLNKILTLCCVRFKQQTPIDRSPSPCTGRPYQKCIHQGTSAPRALCCYLRAGNNLTLPTLRQHFASTTSHAKGEVIAHGVSAFKRWPSYDAARVPRWHGKNCTLARLHTQPLMTLSRETSDFPFVVDRQKVN